MTHNTEGPASRNPPDGRRDLFAKNVFARESIIEKIRYVYELYGFEPLLTPAIERLDVLVGKAGQEAQDSIYRLAGPDKEPLGLRFDLTVPLSRVVAEMSGRRPLPFRRYQLASVWRREKERGAGRYREFTQFDLDSVGVVSEVGDTEIIAAMCDTLDAVDARPFVVRFSSRGLLKALLDFADIPERQHGLVFDVIDNLEKPGPANLRGALIDGYINSKGEAVKGLGLEPLQTAPIETFLKVNAPHRTDAIAELRDRFAHVGGAAAEIDALERISNHLYALGYADDVVRFDPSVSRGLAYYTGTVFESTLLDAPRYGSVFSGGRYDGLVERSPGERIPCTGASIGVDRLVAALQHLERLKTSHRTTRVFVANLDSALMSEYLTLTWELRRQGIPTELYLGAEPALRAQMPYALDREFPLVLLYGRKEQARGVVTVKDMALGDPRRSKGPGKVAGAGRPGETEVRREGIAQTVDAMLKDIDARERS